MARSAPRSSSVQRSSRAWPPAAEAVGAEPSPAVLLLIFGGLTCLGYLYIWSAPTDAGPAPYIRWQFAGDVFASAVWVGIVVALGWRRVAGLVGGTFSWLGAVPLAVLSVAAFAAADTARATPLGPRLELAVGVGTVVAAFTEEIVFRGFLYHGLTRRMGGSAAVIASSLLFAAYHVPRMVREDMSLAFIVFTLIYYFAFGAFLCRVRAQSGSILFPAGIHALWNLTLTQIWIWAIPAGSVPDSTVWMGLAFRAAGLFVAGSLVLRAIRPGKVTGTARA
jgi:membrane protease YdiL (CAAX protease family)